MQTKLIENKTFSEERALYASKNVKLINVRFEGEEDGESALKESRNVEAENCFCDLRYPFWHVRGLKIKNTEMTKNCRAALWYSSDIKIEKSKLFGIKALRECRGAELKNCAIFSPEFGWSSSDLLLENCTAESEYFMLRARNATFRELVFSGKYSFQYVKNIVIENSRLTTKDAFWHAENVLVKNSAVAGEYLGWYSKNVTFENCLITGTQPLCYCKGLRLINCRMEGTDLSFEKSEAYADISSHVESIKNLYAGRVEVESVGEIIRSDKCAKGEIVIKS